ncbi:MAG: c-type cytochrome [Legionellales bacterium]|nr:c-type cytochrome [Legionellales bacterium]
MAILLLFQTCRRLIGLGLLSAVVWTAHAAGDVERGKQLATTCAACHQADGNATQLDWPKLAGQHPAYFIRQMQLYQLGQQEGGRYDPVMSGLAATLSEQDIEDLAAFYASQTVAVGTTDPKWLPRGEQLYRGGDIQKGIPACIACHGPNGQGNEQAGFPVLTGQNPGYVIEELEEYKEGERQSDLYGIMRTIAKRMDQEDIQAVAHYIHGLH